MARTHSQVTVWLIVLGLLFVAPYMVACEGDHSGVEEILEAFDENGDDALNEEEIGDLLEKLIDEAAVRDECPSAATLLAASDADSSGTLTGEEIEHMSSELLPCLTHFQTLETLKVTTDGVEYSCTPPGDGAGHGDHGHRLLSSAVESVPALQRGHRRRRRLAVPDVDAGGMEWSCTEVEVAEDDDHLEEGLVWLYSMIASVASSLCSLIGVVFLIPTVKILRNYGDDIAACALGALLAAVCLHMLPEAVAEAGGFKPLLSVSLLVGFMFAYALEHAVHVSREAVEAVVDPDCSTTDEHQAHHGHHIPRIDEVPESQGDGGLAGAGARLEYGAASTGTDSDCEEKQPPTQQVNALDSDSAKSAQKDGAPTIVAGDADGVVVADEGGATTKCADVGAATKADELPATAGVPIGVEVGAGAGAGAGTGMNTQGGFEADDSVQVVVGQPAAKYAAPQHEHAGHHDATHHGSSAGHGHSHGSAFKNVDTLHSVSDSAMKQLKPMVYVITIGDFFHNMVDGLVIGAAFMGCDASLGWSVMAAVILHELPQELGDFVLLRHAGLSNKSALLFNVGSALGSILGVIIVVGVGSAALDLVGYMLAFGSGVLLFIAASDILPPLMREKSRKRAIIRVAIIIISMAVVALTLLHDVHCESGHGGEHDGHGH